MAQDWGLQKTGQCSKKPSEEYFRNPRLRWNTISPGRPVLCAPIKKVLWRFWEQGVIPDIIMGKKSFVIVRDLVTFWAMREAVHIWGKKCYNIICTKPLTLNCIISF